MRGDKSDSTDTAEGALDSSDSVAAEGDLMAANVDGTNLVSATPLTPDQLAIAIVANIHAKWPNACAQVDASGADIQIVYDDCSGPRGLLHVTGTLVVTVALTNGGSVSLHATGTDIQVNNAVLDVDADAVYSISGADRSLAVTSHGSGVGPRGNAIDHEGDYTLTWNPTTSCGSIDGHWQTDLGSLERSNDLAISKCVAACPTGTLTHHFLGGQSVTVTFDGTATASWSASTGGTGTVALACH